MDKAEFQEKLVHLWMTTDEELTARAIAMWLSVGAAELKGLLKELIADGAITTKRNADNKLTFVVPKKPRPAQIKKLKALKAAKAKQAPTPAQKKAAAAERKRRAQEAAESLAEQPLTAAELEKLAMLTASVETEVESKRKQDEAKRAEEAKLRAAQEAKRAKLAAAKAEQDKPDAPDDDSIMPSKMDLALALFDDEDNKLVKKEDKEKKPGWLTRFRRRFGAKEALEVAGEVKKELEKPKEPGKKKILMSGVLSLFLGPLGWNYAGSFRESLPASVVWVGAAAIAQKMSIFSFMLIPAFLAASCVSGIVGMVYAWQFNKNGKRVRLLGDGKDKKPDEK